MGTRIEIRTQTIKSLHQHEGRQISYFAEECAKTNILPPLFEIITETSPHVSSGEVDDMLRIIGKVPKGAFEIVPPTPCEKRFIGSKPYDEVIVRLVAKLPMLDETENLFNLFFECFQNKLTKSHEQTPLSNPI